jgi:phosphate ABC transporter phosphate-binding protein
MNPPPFRKTPRVRWRRRWAAPAVVLLAAVVTLGPAQPAGAALAYKPINGAGSTWSYNAIGSWITDVAQYQMTINYQPVGSTTGRNEFKQNTVDFAASDIPYGVRDGNNYDQPPDKRGFAYMPVTAGGTTFMYNLKIGTRRVTNLRLSEENIAKIFTGVLTRWNDPAIAADNPGLTLPAIQIVPVVRSDGSGATSQFTTWMLAVEGQYWRAYCAKVGRNPCTQTSAYPPLNGSAMHSQSGDSGVAGYVSQEGAAGAIGYVEYSYAIAARFPVAKVLNKAGYYTEPTAGHVAVSLLAAKINPDKSNLDVYLTQDLSNVYTDTDPRTYELSSYSYLILPTDLTTPLTTEKGRTLAAFGQYAICGGQKSVGALGYSPLPINLVEAGFGQLQRVPGNEVANQTQAQLFNNCYNPTFSTDGTNTLAKNDPYPQACDKKGATQCTAGTGGAAGTSTANNGNGGNGGAGGATAGGANPSGSAGPGASNGSSGAGDANCDPDSGACAVGADSADASGPNQVDAIPTDSSADQGNFFGVVLMVVGALLLIGLALVPPLIAQLGGRGRTRRDRWGDM